MVLYPHLVMHFSASWLGNSSHNSSSSTWLVSLGHCIGGFVNIVRGFSSFLCWLIILLRGHYSFHYYLNSLCMDSLVEFQATCLVASLVDLLVIFCGCRLRSKQTLSSDSLGTGKVSLSLHALVDFHSFSSVLRVVAPCEQGSLLWLRPSCGFVPPALSAPLVS